MHRFSPRSSPRRLAVSIAAGLLTVAAALVTVDAAASPLLDTLGPIGGNAGAQGVVSGPGASSTYFNPAMLIDADPGVLIGFAVASAQVGVTLDGRTSGDVPLVVGGRDLVGPDGKPIPNDVVPTPWLQRGCPAGTKSGECAPPGFAARPRQSQGTSSKPRSYLVLGFVKDLIPQRFTVGLYGVVPLSTYTTARGFYADEREALFSNSLHPEMYGDRMTAVSLVFGGAFQLLPNLSVGAGLSLSLTNSAGSSTYVRDQSNYDTLLLDNSVQTQISVSPTVGVRWQAAKWLKIGSTLHAPQSFVIDTNVTAALPSGTESSTSRRDVFDWTPWSLVFGASADVVEQGAYKLAVVGSATYSAWSSYQDRHGDNPNVYGSDMAFKDTVGGALGLRHTYKKMRAFVDVVWVPTPVPKQVGRSNYVDNDRLGFTFGADVELGGIRPGFSMFVHRLIPRHQAKDPSRIRDELPDDSVYADAHDPVPGAQGLQTNNPGYPGFGSSGWLWGGAVTLTVPL